MIPTYHAVSKSLLFSEFLESIEDLPVERACIFRSRGHKLAWVKNPAGNFLSVIEEEQSK